MSFTFVGNTRVIETVHHFVNEQHIPHAIIITGDDGTGKRTLANYIAKAAVCMSEHPVCDNCRTCHMFDGGNHPDVIYIGPEDKKKNINVGQIRKLRSDAYIKPHMSGKKVFIINKAHTMNEQSQNALLKILEEPPINVIIILIGESLSPFLETIISRCVCLQLIEPEFSDAVDYIKATNDCSLSDIENAVAAARNNIGKALKLLGRNSSFANALAKEFADALFSNAGAYRLLELLCPLYKDRVTAGEFTAILKAIIADKIRNERANSVVLPRLLKYYDIICEIEPALVTNINLGLFFTGLVSRLKD